MENQIALNQEEIHRYDRHLRLPGFGVEKQMKLKNAKILIIGAGGLGCPIAMYLAASGVGKIGIADADTVDLCNLQRQIAYSVDDIGENKAIILTEKVKQLNPLVKAIVLPMRIDISNIESIISDYELIIDGTDNFASRFLIADACYLTKKSYLHAAVYEYGGQISLFLPSKSPCFRCLFRQPPSLSALPPCAEAGILGVVTGVIGTMAATEAIKYITGLDNSMAGKIITADVISNKFKKYEIERDENCPLCGKKPQIKDMQQLVQSFIGSCDQRLEANEYIISTEEANKLLADGEKTKALILDVREDHEYLKEHIDDSILWALSEIRSLPVEILAEQLNKKLKKEKKKSKNGQHEIILCYCQRGARSLKAVTMLRQAGVENIFSVDGGLDEWQVK